jgi:hypothetical protein
MQDTMTPVLRGTICETPDGIGYGDSILVAGRVAV